MSAVLRITLLLLGVMALAILLTLPIGRTRENTRRSVAYSPFQSPAFQSATGSMPAISPAAARRPPISPTNDIETPVPMAEKSEAVYVASNAVVHERRVVMEAAVTLEVSTFESVYADVNRIAREAGGYVSSSRLNLPAQGKPGGTLTIRLPQDSFDQALASIRKLGKVTAETQSAKDVTQQYVDLEARVRNLKAEDARVLELMQRARTLEEIFDVEKRLTEVRGKIETLEGQLRLLRFQVAMATITVTLTEKATVVAVPETGWIWRNQVNNALVGVRAVVQGVITVATYVGVYAILWVPLLALTLRAGRRYSRRKELSEDV